MKNSISATALGLSLALSVPACGDFSIKSKKEEKAPSPVSITGRVPDGEEEVFTPASMNAASTHDRQLNKSHLSFPLLTKEGRLIIIQVEEVIGVTHESIAALVASGRSLTLEVPQDQVDQQIITIRADLIKPLKAVERATD